MKFDASSFERAYKKLKSYVYNDKTQLVLRSKIVEYEMEYSEFSLDNRFKKLNEMLTSSSSEKWDQYISDCLDSIKILTLPKELFHDKQNIVFNSSNNRIEINKSQFYFDSNVELQILGVLWILTLGVYLDKSFYNHSYGNRIRKSVINEDSKEFTFSPYLFMRYSDQYESWRDRGLKEAEECLEKHQDVLIISLDLKSFFYSINISKDNISEIFNEYSKGDPKDIATERLNTLVYHVIERYSNIYNAYKDYLQKNQKEVLPGGENIFLPINYLPSNVLSNWFLDKFDKAVVDQLNPIYYGRYVDDMLIVEKIEKNSRIFENARSGKLKQEEVIQHFLCRCKKVDQNICNFGSLLFPEDDKQNPETSDQTVKSQGKEYTGSLYKLNKNYLVGKNSDILLSSEKVKIYYFMDGQSSALLTCFRKEITKNKSEFRFLPEDNEVLPRRDYSEIYNLKRSDTINKLRGVDDVLIDKFSLSKFLGKHTTINSKIIDKLESKFERDLLKIFDSHVTIENYLTWEKTIQILVSNNNYTTLKDFLIQTINYINNIFTEPEISEEIYSIGDSLLLFLFSATCRPLSLVWGHKIKNLIANISEEIKNTHNTPTALKVYNIDSFRKYRNGYCYTRMVNKYLLPLMIDTIHNPLKVNSFNDTNQKTINLLDLNYYLTNCKNLNLSSEDYKYYPYLVGSQDIALALMLHKLIEIDKSGNSHTMHSDAQLEKTKVKYRNLNYQTQIINDRSEVISSEFIDDNMDDFFPITSEAGDLNSQTNITCNITKIGSEKKGEIVIAVANAKLSENNFVLALTKRPNRSYARLNKLTSLINQAIAENVDILVLPENYVPYEWIPLLSRICARNEFVIITGIEHLVIGNSVSNLTTTIIPFRSENYRFSHTFFHEKVHFSPYEIDKILGYGLKPQMGNSYELFNWKDLWFSPYCCFEVASIFDRSIFFSYLDLMIVVEWNKDTNYYSNIIESLSRDLHCFCVQVNDSEYGDSRITQPAKSVIKDIVRTKGGINETILVGKINIEELRNFQIVEYNLQKENDKFKPTPPNFDKSVVKSKILGTLSIRTVRDSICKPESENHT